MFSNLPFFVSWWKVKVKNRFKICILHFQPKGNLILLDRGIQAYSLVFNIFLMWSFFFNVFFSMFFFQCFFLQCFFCMFFFCPHLRPFFLDECPFFFLFVLNWLEVLCFFCLRSYPHFYWIYFLLESLWIQSLKRITFGWPLWGGGRKYSNLVHFWASPFLFRVGGFGWGGGVGEGRI